jgi:hypothetical protein
MPPWKTPTSLCAACRPASPARRALRGGQRLRGIVLLQLAGLHE